MIIPNRPAAPHGMLDEVRDNLLLFAWFWLLPTAMVFGTLPGLKRTEYGVAGGMALLAVGLLLLVLHQKSRQLAAWVFVIGWFAINLAMAAWAGMAQALWLISFSAGLALLFIGFEAGVGFVITVTLVMWAAPATWLPVAAGARMLPVLATWGMFGIVWLALRPVQSAGEMMWSAYRQSQELLEVSRDDQLRLQQTLTDLHAANEQLVRLNRWADGLRQEAEEARRTKEQFVANVSHELRTPLNMIIGFSEMIVNTPHAYGRRLPPALVSDLMVVLRNSQHLASLIDDVLDLSQLEAGQMALDREPVMLSEVIGAASTAVRPLYESKGLYLRVELPEELPAVMADRTRIREVILNLLSNAGRFTERGGVMIRIEQQHDELVVSVADTGPGIAETDQARLFQPFQQLDGTFRRRYGGTGLGLSISKRFVELHGGRMWVESMAGSGATFYFCLPLSVDPPARAATLRWLVPGWEFLQRTHPSLAEKVAVRQRIVVYDTGAALTNLLSHYLPDIEVVTRPDLPGAIAEATASCAQALLVNVGSVAEALRWPEVTGSQLKGMTTIICSVPGSSDVAHHLGVSEYLVKPIGRDQLLATLDRLALAGKTILVADDDEDLLRLLWRLLNAAGRGYRILTADNGREAWRILREDRPDAILLDLMMPGMDGFELLAAKNADPLLAAIPAVIISARDPLGHLIVSRAVAVTRGEGLSLPQLLACIEAINAILSPMPLPSDPTPAAVPLG